MILPIHCSCEEGMLEYTRGNVLQAIAGKQIVLLDCPHFFCNNCGRVAYAKESGVLDLIKYAHSKAYNVVVWPSDEN